MKTIKETLEGIHWHFVVVAGNKVEKQEEEGKFGMQVAVYLDILEADTEKEAIEIAKGKIERDIYVVQQMRQCVQCGFMKQNQQSLEKMLKIMKDD